MGDEEEMQVAESAPPLWRNQKRLLSKQLSMCETKRERDWDRRRRQILRQERKKEEINGNNNGGGGENSSDHGLTDEDLSELKGCIELGFGFSEEELAASGTEKQKLSNTLPALDLYFAVHRERLHGRSNPLTMPTSSSTGSLSMSGSLVGSPSSSLGSPTSDSDSWKICSPGDDPKQVKTKLRHWAQAVACSVMQSQ